MKNKLPILLMTMLAITACSNESAPANNEEATPDTTVEDTQQPTTDETEEQEDEADAELTETDEEETEDADVEEETDDTNQSTSTYKEGTYTAIGHGVGGDVEVIVDFSNDAITNIEIGEHDETSGISETPIEVIPAQIVEHQSLAVDSISGATYTSSAIKSAVAQAVEEADGDVEALKAKEVIHEAVDEEFEYDVVVAGGGLSGLMSAYEAARNGANVALIEKNGILGGTSITASGNMLVAHNDEDKITMKQGWLDRSYSQELNPIDMEMLDALIDASPQVMELYDEAGVDYREDVNEENGSIIAKVNPNEASKRNAENITIPSKDANAKGGPALIFTLRDKLEELGVDIYLNTPVTELINEDGTIKGLVSETLKDGTKTFHADAVVLATGDYAHNEEMDKEYNKRGAGEYSATAVGNTGDGHQLALEAGAEMNPFQDSMSGVFNANPYDLPMIGDPTNGYPFEALLLNMDGVRVYKEDGKSHPQKFEFVREDGINTAWAIMDSEVAENFVRLDEYLEKTENDDPIIRVYKADTIEELSNLMELAPAVVEEQLDRYNELAAKGEDEDFGKAPEFLKEINEGPYYAALLYDNTRGVFGGIKTNTKAEVVDKDDNPIPGLYASGAISNGQFFGDFYPGSQALAVASHMGYIAGQSASEYAVENNAE